MPTLLIGVVIIDVPPSCNEAMIVFPDKEHLPGEMCKIRILLRLDVEFCGGLLQEKDPRGHNGRANWEVHKNVVESRHVNNPITLSVSHYKFTFQPLHLYLTDRTDEREGFQPAQRNG
jgi:hypothetical protein